MLIVDSKDCENIDKALKKYKKKYEKSKILLQLRERQTFTKPSVKRRNQILKAVTSKKFPAEKSNLSFFSKNISAAIRFNNFMAVYVFSISTGRRLF